LFCAQITDAEWSSNGRTVFRSDRLGGSELWIARAGGTELESFFAEEHWLLHMQNDRAQTLVMIGE
jgi:hypothetical protein